MHNIAPYQEATTSLTLKEKVGQFFFPAAFINDTEEEILKLESLIKEYHIGGLCFFHSRASAATNFEGKKEVMYNEDSISLLIKLIERYQKAAKYPLLISIDAEWGLAMRVENTPQYPYAITLGAVQNNNALIEKIGQQIALDCMFAGIHWNLSPVVDINNNPLNPVIGYRSFGEHKTLVTEKAKAFIQGATSVGHLCSIKHFPGHGDTAVDSHLGLPVINTSKEALWKNELYPFKALIQQGVDAVMVGHLCVPALTNSDTIPTTISKEVVTHLLREELQFDGVIVSDALNMHSVSKMFPEKGVLEAKAFAAGMDALCFSEHTKEGIASIIENENKERIEASFKRIWNLKEKAALQKAHTPKALSNPTSINTEIAKKSITLYQGTTEDIRKFKEEGYTKIAIQSKKHNIFFESLPQEQEDKNNVLLAIFPPKVKPQNTFDLTKEELQTIQQLIEEKNVVLYLFGNPYVLNLLNTAKAKAVVIVYQDFDVFQEQAAAHFLGKIKAEGKIPVTINTNNHE